MFICEHFFLLCGWGWDGVRWDVNVHLKNVNATMMMGFEDDSPAQQEGEAVEQTCCNVHILILFGVTPCAQKGRPAGGNCQFANLCQTEKHQA